MNLNIKVALNMRKHKKRRKEYTARSAKFYSDPETWGWYWIIKETHEKLMYLDKNYTINQIKEKFGGLRYYYETSEKADRNPIIRDIMDSVIQEAEWLASNTCEGCGCSKVRSSSAVKYDNTVKKRGDGWTKTLCDGCSVEREIRKSNA